MSDAWKDADARSKGTGRPRRSSAGALAVVLLAGGLAACSQTTYVNVRDGSGGLPQAQENPETFEDGESLQSTPSNAEEDVPLVERKVRYGLTRAFFATPPTCALVLPVESRDVPPETARVISEAVARHMLVKIDRVVGPARVKRVIRRRALDPYSNQDDRRRLGRALKCDTIMEVGTPGLQETYAVVWAYAKLPLSLQLVRAKDGTALWWGHHAAERADGGLPTGIFSLPTDVVYASRFASDDDRLPSMADDAARRVLTTLPGLRGDFGG